MDKKFSAEQVAAVSTWLYDEYFLFYQDFLKILHLAKLAFEKRDFTNSVNLSAKRLSLYSTSIADVSSRLQAAHPEIHRDITLWDDVDRHYSELIRDQYAEDVGRAYLHSLRRKVYQGEWRADDYSFAEMISPSSEYIPRVLSRFELPDGLSDQIVGDILLLPEFIRNYADLARDTGLVRQRIQSNLGKSFRRSLDLVRVEMINTGFYRNRGAYLVGRLVFTDNSFVPLIIALLNDESGIYVDAVLTSETYAHNIFSSTLANFHVTSDYYHEVCAMLKSIMPKRPLGLHYSTIGYNHLGKVAVMSELEAELVDCETGLENAVGSVGTVAMGFASKNSAYNLKVIRDKPTENYKWGAFEGVESVLRKYTRIHEINRTGSMLDSIIYYKVRLDRRWFSAELL
ncbi:MAG: isocitrate dehydrogenase kinase/phosphatase, partial [Gammaproteobacteria bacterium]